MTDDLAADVRDHLDRLDIPIRPTIKHGRVQILQETDPDENGAVRAPEVYATVMAFLTDAEPDDQRLVPLLAEGFRGDRIPADVIFEIPTVESEEALAASVAADNARGAEYVARSGTERTPDAKPDDQPYAEIAELFE